MQKIKTVLHEVRRTNDTAQGNPVYRLQTDAGEYLTQKDGRISYVADSPGGQGVEVVLDLADDGRVGGIEAP